MVLALNTTVMAQQDKKPKKHPNQVADTGQVDEPAQVTAPDADSKLFGPRTGEGVVVVFHGNGRVTAFLDESFEEASVVTRMPDGTLRRTCVHALEAASAHVHKTAEQPPAKPLLEEKE
jgi:hypothetical protein